MSKSNVNAVKSERLINILMHVCLNLIIMSLQLKGGGDIVFGADPVGVHVASFPHVIF